MRRLLSVLVCAGMLGGMNAADVWAGSWEMDLESGLVGSGPNVVRIPGEGGTQISLVDDLKTANSPFYRLKVYYNFNPEHAVGVLYAPLSLFAEGEATAPIRFEEYVFPANTPIQAMFRFNSYRLAYRYCFWSSEKMRAHIGFTAKVRDAEIRLEGNGVTVRKTNVGFVPLLYFRLAWDITGPWGLVVDADALAAPQGRAEDVLIALVYRADEHWQLKTGYRMVEGGADNKEVYNFALVHYAVLGVVASY